MEQEHKHIMEVIEVNDFGDIEISNIENQQKTIRIVAERLRTIGDELDKTHSLDRSDTSKRVRRYFEELMFVSLKHLAMAVEYLQSLES